MSNRSELLESIAKTIADYRAGEIDAPTSEHVETWIEQFDNEVQEPLLTELDHVLKKTYMPQQTVREFLSTVVRSHELVGDDPCSFWHSVKFLSIQGGGHSQREMLQMLATLLRADCDLQIEDCGGDHPKVFMYIDDGIFTGNRMKNDLTSWIRSSAPHQATVHVATIALHRGGQHYAGEALNKAASDAGKDVDVKWWSCLTIEDRKAYTDISDVLRPTTIPADEPTRKYVESLKFPPVLRTPDSVGNNEFFSSEKGRHLLEQELLKAGVRIRSMCPYLNVYQRPLGNMVLETLGFGALLVTFRNCPNNCPLAFWAGDPWYPLFPRKTN